MKIEIWKTITGYENRYEVSNLGRVKSCAGYRKNKRSLLKGRKFKERILRCVVDNISYPAVSLYGDNGKFEKIRVHILVAKEFLPKKPGGQSYEINHKDGIRNNNNCINLEWVTRADNILHKTIFLGNAKKKLTHKQVTKIKKQLKKPYHGLYLHLAKKYNVSTMTIYSIRDNKTWSHV